MASFYNGQITQAAQNRASSKANSQYIEDKRNLIFVGRPGTDKTHLASAIGINAASKGKTVRFWNVLDLVNKLELDKDSKQYKLNDQV